jgi:hypothetical protein
MATRTITLTDIPEAVYERLRKDAEDYGLSIAELVRRDLIERTPTEKIRSLREWFAWLDTLEPIDVPPGAVVEALHAGRAERY